MQKLPKAPRATLKSCSSMSGNKKKKELPSPGTLNAGRYVGEKLVQTMEQEIKGEKSPPTTPVTPYGLTSAHPNLIHVLHTKLQTAR